MEEPGTSGVKETKKKAKVEKKVAEATETKHKKTMVEEVCQAVGTLGIPRKGASAQAVRKYILSKYEESEHGRVKNRLNQAFGKALEQGMLTRPASSKDSTGATGYFILAKKTDKEKGKSSDAKMKKTEVPDSDEEEPPSKPSKGSKKLFSQSKTEDKASKPKQTNTKPKSKTTNEKDAAPKKPKKTKAVKTTKEEEQMSDSEVLPSKKAKQLKSHSSDSELMDFAEKKTAKSKVVRNPAKSAKTDVPEKSNASKSAKNTKVSKKKPVLNETFSSEDRKDLSDSEILVKKATRKSIKSYSSDSELPDSNEKSAPVKEPAKKRQNTKH